MADDLYVTGIVSHVLNDVDGTGRGRVEYNGCASLRGERADDQPLEEQPASVDDVVEAEHEGQTNRTMRTRFAGHGARRHFGQVSPVLIPPFEHGAHRRAHEVGFAHGSAAGMGTGELAEPGGPAPLTSHDECDWIS